MAYYPKYFLVLCQDRLHDPNGKPYSLYFINLSDTKIKRLDVKTGGYATIDHELVNLEPTEKTWTNLPPRAFCFIQTAGKADFDYVLWYNVKVITEEKEQDLAFHIPKHLIDAKREDNLPLLGLPGYVFYPME